MTADRLATLDRAPRPAAHRPLLFRELIGESLREERTGQGKTLREVSTTARVSLGYLSEVERGQKEASSELLAAICGALQTPLSQVLHVVSEKMATCEGTISGETALLSDKITTLPLRSLSRAA